MLPRHQLVPPHTVCRHRPVGDRAEGFAARDASFGRFVGKARAMAREFQDSFEEIAREAELEEMRNEAAKLRAGMNANLNTGPAIPLTPAEEEKSHRRPQRQGPRGRSPPRCRNHKRRT